MARQRERAGGRVDRVPDLGAWLTVVLARPLAAFGGESREEVVKAVRPRHDSIREMGLNCVTRCVAWLMAGVIFFGLRLWRWRSRI